MKHNAWNVSDAPTVPHTLNKKEWLEQVQSGETITKLGNLFVLGDILTTAERTSPNQTKVVQMIIPYTAKLLPNQMKPAFSALRLVNDRAGLGEFLTSNHH